MILRSAAAAALLALSMGAAPLPALAQGSSSCGTPHTPGSTTLTLQSGGLQRSAILHVPASYNPATAYPLILNLHAYTSSAAAQESISGMDAEADSRGALVAYPQGTNGSNGQPGWDIPGPHADEPAALAGLSWQADDVRFLGDLVATLEAGYCVDASRVAVVGFSMGGIMAWALACNAPAWLASVDPVAATPPSGTACANVPYQAFHGALDGVDLYGGNAGNPPLPTVLGCSGVVATFGSVQELGCPSGALYDATGDGHTWPASPYGWLLGLFGYGATTYDINASRLIVQHAASHPR